MAIKKFFVVLISMILLTGCATYKFQRGPAPYDKGYVVARDDLVIPEYTLGKENTVPPKIKLARERFSRRKAIVEQYYKRMGLIEERAEYYFVNMPFSFVQFVTGVFRLPAIAISDYKYTHDPQYRERYRKLADQKEEENEARVRKLKAELYARIQKDLESEKELIK